MRNHLFLTITATTFLLVACHLQPQYQLTENEKEFVECIQKIYALQADIATKYLPEMGKVEFRAPIIFYSDTACYAINPSKGFLQQFDAQHIYTDKNLMIYKTSLLDSASFHMETHTELFDSATWQGNIPYIRCTTFEITQAIFPDIETQEQWIPMIIHELAHGYQYSIPQYFKSRSAISFPIHELELLQYQKKYLWLDQFLQQENALLLKALSTPKSIQQDSLITQFKEVRKQRKNKMREELGNDIVQLEETHELGEALARLCEVEAILYLTPIEQKNELDWYSHLTNGGYFFVTGYNLIRLCIEKDIPLHSLYTSSKFIALEDFL